MRRQKEFPPWNRERWERKRDSSLGVPASFLSLSFPIGAHRCGSAILNLPTLRPFSTVSQVCGNLQPQKYLCSYFITVILLLFTNHNANIMVFQWSMVDPCESDVCPPRVCVPQVENHHSRSWEVHWTEKKPRVKIRCSSLDRRREVNPVRKVTVKVTHG